MGIHRFLIQTARGKSLNVPKQRLWACGFPQKKTILDHLLQKKCVQPHDIRISPCRLQALFQRGHLSWNATAQFFFQLLNLHLLTRCSNCRTKTCKPKRNFKMWIEPTCLWSKNMWNVASKSMDLTDLTNPSVDWTSETVDWTRAKLFSPTKTGI